MRRGKGVVLAVLVLGLLPLVGCQDLVIDKEKLFRPGEVSEIVGFLAGFGTTFAAVPDLLAMLPAAVKRGHESPHGRHHGCVSGPLGLLRLVDCFSPSHHLERDRRLHQLPDGRRLRTFPQSGKAGARCRSRQVHESVIGPVRPGDVWCEFLDEVKHECTRHRFDRVRLCLRRRVGRNVSPERSTGASPERRVEGSRASCDRTAGHDDRLVLGLLIGSAKASYDTQGNELTQGSVKILMLDRALVHYGPETKDESTPKPGLMKGEQ